MASYVFSDSIFSTDADLDQPQLGTLTQVAENNLLSTKDYTLIVSVTNINTNVVVQLDGSIDGTNFAQMLAKAYKARGGGYKGGKSEGQKDLKRWGNEKWMTREEYEKKKDD